MLNMRASGANDAFVKINEHLMCYPEHELKVRGLTTKEVTRFCLTILNPYDRIVNCANRRISMRYLIGELAWYLRGSDRTDEIAFYSKFWNKISDDGKTANSAYGKRLFLEQAGGGTRTQLGYVIDELKRDTNSRKAVMVIYDKTDSYQSKDNPCTLSLQFMIRNNRLDLITTMRSNDLYFGLCYDIPFFTTLQEMVLEFVSWQEPELQMGHYFHNVGSMHIYEKDFETATKVMEDPRVDPTLPEQFPRINADDLTTWFSDLMWYERQTRNNIRTSVARSTTNFQRFCIEHLGEK